VLSIPSASANPTYSWDFGDGSHWNGSGAGYSAPTHLYTNGGEFTATVAASAPPASYLCSVGIVVRSTQVLVRIVSTPDSGTAPLRVAFQAVAFGGSGTYDRFDWSFGDGGLGSGPQVNHTFATTGQFLVTLNVTDTDGSAGSAQTQIVVTPTASGSSLPPWARSAEAWATWLLGGLSVVLAIVLVILLRSSAALRRSRDEPRTGTPGSDGTAGAVRPESTELARSSEAAPPPSRTTPSPVRGALPAEDLRPSRELLLTSERLILHIAAQGTLRPDEVATTRFTQAGIHSALGVSQSSISNALRRLERAGIVEHDVRHVQRARRRVKVYTLTARGYALAKELRTR
jgi:PKD repeat protein